MKLQLLSPERKLLEGLEVDEVTLPSSEGQIQVLPGHAPMVGSMDTGVFNYRGTDGKTSSGVISMGFFEVRADDLVVMAETIELKGEIDIDRAKRAQKQAEETLKAADLDEHQFNKYQLKLQRALVRQQLAGKEFTE